MSKLTKKVYPALLSVMALGTLAFAKPSTTHASNINQLSNTTRTVKKTDIQDHKATNAKLNQSIVLPKKQSNTNIKKQTKKQLSPKLVKKVHKSIRKDNKKIKKNHHKRGNWYADGLSKSEQQYRAKVVYLESRGKWNVTNGSCWGRFQLKSAYLGYKNGHVNLNHKHQVKVADAYVTHRYGTWHNAYVFHLHAGWY